MFILSDIVGPRLAENDVSDWETVFRGSTRVNLGHNGFLLKLSFENMADGEERSIEDDLKNALEHVENQEAEYWIRTALQRLVTEREGPNQGSS